MDYQYKIIVSNRSIYKEFKLYQDMHKVKLGTTAGCEFRLNPTHFFGEVELEFVKSDQGWEILCADSVYISRGDMRKLLSVMPEHGDIFYLKYASSGDEAFELRFMIDFEAKLPFYNWKTDLSVKENWLIADDVQADIRLNSVFSQNISVRIYKSAGEYVVEELHSEFGVYQNGQSVRGKVRLADYDFVAIADFSFFYKEGCIYFDREGVDIQNIKAEEQQPSKNSLVYPLFNRSTRLLCQLPEKEIDILVPPAVPKKPEENLVMLLLPALMMLALTVVVRGFMSNSSNNTFIIFSVCSMSIGILTSLAAFIRTKKKYKKECQERVEQYTAYAEGKRKEIFEARQKELEALNSVYHDLDYDIAVIENFASDLFDRMPKDDDFLKVYIGKGSIKSARQVNYKEQETFETNDELAEIPLQITQDFQYIDNAPVVVDVRHSDVVGIVGSREDNYGFLKNILIDLAARHYYGDVKVVLLLDDNTEQYTWVKYLPHIMNKTGTRSLVYDNETKNNIFELLYKELSIRQENKENTKQEYLVILVMEERGLKNHPLSRFMECASALNTAFVFFEQYAEQLPLCCNELIELVGNGTGLLYDVKKRNHKTQFKYHVIDDMTAACICRKLSPVYCEEISLESSLRKNISLFELLRIYSVSDIDLKQRWKESQVYSSMAVPLGVNSKNEVVYLDLHEKAHGPHGLVAGTTGSGKSEILQTFILSAATLFHPYEISFVIIDFKGGGMVNQFKDLPHLAGAITNIDGKEIERSLKSIKAELLKRQTLFADAGVNHIDKYIKLYKAGQVGTALPHLVVIVDEFAELKAEQPEFMKELISAARIGRSLGIHLILATQKPAGQVNEQIWSNSRCRICLKVQNREDSNEVLKSPLAAEIKEPGRAYLQVGNNEIFELLQSAYSGAPEKTESGSEKEFAISAVDFGGKRKTLYTRKGQTSDKSGKTQLEALVQYIGQYCASQGIERLPDICLPPLEDTIDITDGQQDYTLDSVPVGIYDDPDLQYQGEARFNFCEANTMIIGSSAAGKTNLLQVIIRQIASKFSPREVSFYIMDFGAMYLKNFEQLNHVGGIVTISEEEKLRNLFKLLLEEIRLRKEKFMKMGISSFAAYKEAGYTEFPQVFLMIDNFAAFKEIYGASQEENFIYITREGLASGICVIVSNSQTAGLGYRYMSSFACRMAFYCNDSTEYTNLFERCRLKPNEVPGRAVCRLHKDLYEMQTFLAFSGEKEIERSAAIKEFVSHTNARYGTEHAKRIPEIPDVLDYRYIGDNFRYERKAFAYPIALDYDSVDVVSLDFRRVNEFAIIGNDSTKRMRALDTLFKAVEHYVSEEGVKAFIIDNAERPLKKKSVAAYVEKYTIESSFAGEMIIRFAEEFEQRYKLLLDEGMEAIEKLPLYLAVVNSRDAVEYISTNKNVLESYNKIIKQYRNLGICFVYSDIEDVPAAYSAPEIIKRLKENKKAFITTESLKEFKFCEIPSGILRTSKDLKNGDVYLLNGTVVQRVRLITAGTAGNIEEESYDN